MFPAPFSRTLPAPLRSLAEHRTILRETLRIEDDIEDAAVFVPRANVTEDELVAVELRRGRVMRALRKIFMEGSRG